MRTRMSAREFRRTAVLARAKAGTLRLGSAATLMGVSRPAATGGRRSNRAPRGRTPTGAGLCVGNTGARKGERFGPEHLASDDGVPVHRETLGDGWGGGGFVAAAVQAQRPSALRRADARSRRARAAGRQRSPVV